MKKSIEDNVVYAIDKACFPNIESHEKDVVDKAISIEGNNKQVDIGIRVKDKDNNIKYINIMEAKLVESLTKTNVETQADLAASQLNTYALKLRNDKKLFIDKDNATIFSIILIDKHYFDVEEDLQEKVEIAIKAIANESMIMNCEQLNHYELLLRQMEKFHIGVVNFRLDPELVYLPNMVIGGYMKITSSIRTPNTTTHQTVRLLDQYSNNPFVSGLKNSREKTPDNIKRLQKLFHNTIIDKSELFKQNKNNPRILKEIQGALSGDGKVFAYNPDVSTYFEENLDGIDENKYIFSLDMATISGQHSSEAFKNRYDAKDDYLLQEQRELIEFLRPSLEVKSISTPSLQREGIRINNNQLAQSHEDVELNLFSSDIDNIILVDKYNDINYLRPLRKHNAHKLPGSIDLYYILQVGSFKKKSLANGDLVVHGAQEVKTHSEEEINLGDWNLQRQLNFVKRTKDDLKLSTVRFSEAYNIKAEANTIYNSVENAVYNKDTSEIKYLISKTDDSTIKEDLENLLRPMNKWKDNVVYEEVMSDLLISLKKKFVKDEKYFQNFVDMVESTRKIVENYSLFVTNNKKIKFNLYVSLINNLSSIKSGCAVHKCTLTEVDTYCKKISDFFTNESPDTTAWQGSGNWLEMYKWTNLYFKN